MKISDIIKSDKLTLSFEVFPPKTEAAYESVAGAIDKIADLKPSFMSVTYGAGGGTSEYTVSIAENIQKNKNVVSLAHLSCISSSKETVHNQLTKLKAAGIENILALRGDIPQGLSTEHLDYKFASDLAEEIKNFGGFCIGGACYPEGHPDSPNQNDDIENKLTLAVNSLQPRCSLITTFFLIIFINLEFTELIFLLFQELCR